MTAARAKTILVEHDITFDLYAQMLAQKEDWETRRQYDRWVAFEREAWKRVDRVVVMSERDQATAGDALVDRSLVVDLQRFRPSQKEPEPRRLLFIGSFAHRPNVLAMEFFMRDVFPKLDGVTLHVIAGKRHETFFDLKGDRIEVEGFVSDVRPAYERAAVVIAPLIASAGTNIKIMEAMAMGKAIVSTEAGIHGIDLERGRDAIVAESADEMANAITQLLDDSEETSRDRTECPVDRGTIIWMGRDRAAASGTLPPLPAFSGISLAQPWAAPSSEIRRLPSSTFEGLTPASPSDRCRSGAGQQCPERDFCHANW